MLTTILLCSKFGNDVYYSNEQVGQLGGVTCAEMNLLEKYFLDIVDYRLNVDEPTYRQYEEGLLAHMLQLQTMQE